MNESLRFVSCACAELKSRKLYLVGEPYAGTYIRRTIAYLLEHKKA